MQNEIVIKGPVIIVWIVQYEYLLLIILKNINC